MRFQGRQAVVRLVFGCGAADERFGAGDAEISFAPRAASASAIMSHPRAPAAFALTEVPSTKR
jgi:hypothetical protein